VQTTFSEGTVWFSPPLDCGPEKSWCHEGKWNWENQLWAQCRKILAIVPAACQ